MSVFGVVTDNVGNSAGSVAGDVRLRELIEHSLVEHPARTMDDLLRDVVTTAAEVIGCEYAAVSVIGAGGSTEHFVPYGVDAETAERIGHSPEHRGLLGAIVRDGLSIRTDDISLDPRTAGLPPEHPVVHSLLGVPIMLRGRAAGALYMSGPLRGDHFTEAEERTAVTIAVAAANVIEKARTVAENARRNRWLTGATELVRDIAAGRYTDPHKLVVQRLTEIADADLAYIVQPGAIDDSVVVTAAHGRNADRWDGYVLPAATSLAAAVLRSGQPRNVVHLEDGILPDDVRSGVDIDAVLLVPLRGTHGSRGVLAVSRGRGRAQFTFGEMGMMTMFAGQVALALELADVQARRDQMALVEERDRIARDLHDHVIQRLFAVGLTLQSAGMNVAGRPAAQLRTSVDEIDETIKQIRSTIYRLTMPIVSPDGSLRAQATRMLDDLELVLGFRPSLTFDGPVDFGLDDDVIDDCVAVLREALTNVARHARATRTEVAVRVAGHAIAIEIRDDGRGIGATSRRSGLSNMRVRAERRRGTLRIESTGGHGTSLVWTVPLRTGEPAGAVE